MPDPMLRPATPADLDALLALVRAPEIADSIAFHAAEELTRAIERPDGDGEVLVVEHGIRVFERAGFTRESIRRAAYDRHGAWQDGILFGRVAED
jgi:hypothetical protein